MPLGAKYRLIDIPISNCINSEIHRIYVLTQFNSASLNRHLARTYALAGAGFSQGFVEVLAAQQTPDNPCWFQGTADAVRQYLGLLAEWDVDQYLILSGDHLVAPQLNVVTSTIARSDVAVPVKDARVASVVPSAAAAHEMPTVLGPSSNGR